MSDDLQQAPQGDFIFYTDANGKLRIEVYFAGETVWLTQTHMAALFDVDRTVISKHLKNIFESDELDKESNVQKMHVAHSAKPVYYYSLDVIISVGYRVNSLQATAFRKWATETLRNFMIKGFVLDKDRLKNGTHFGKDYFDELLDQVREIRASERRVHLKLSDIFELSADYDSRSEITKQFFAFVQNKLHYAITGKTAAEIRHARADAAKDHMGLTTWAAAPNGKIIKRDTAVAKNFLSKVELTKLERAVVSFLDIAETRAENGKLTKMADWLGVMNGYLDLNDFPKLVGAGKISKAVADKKAFTEYDKFRVIQDRLYESDFERSVQKIESGEADEN